MNPPSQHEEQQREQVFTALVTPWIEPLRRYLARRADPAVADDVLADTLLVLWRRADELPHTDGLPWAIGIARWQLSNAVRGERRRRRLTARVGIVDDPARRSGDRLRGGPSRQPSGTSSPPSARGTRRSCGCGPGTT